MLIAVLLLSFCAAFTGTWLWMRIASARLWLDLPNQRSSHEVPTPKSGGAGFVAAFLLFVLLMYMDDRVTLQQVVLCNLGLILAVTGFLDDLRNLGIATRIGIQLVVAALAATVLAEPPAVSFPWGSLTNAWILWPTVVLALVWLINLVNFMDGIDALAATEAIYFCLALAGFAILGNQMPLVILALGLAVSVCGFLYFNLPPARIFMGDLGSNFLGYMVGVLGLIAITMQVVNVWTILVLLGVFIMDATVTLVERMRAGLVWYHSHRSHAYQRAALRYGGHGKVVVGTGLINLLWLLPLAWLTTRMESAGLIITAAAWLPLLLLGRHYRKPARQRADVPAA
jgi:Fuc2NAc and GlcNAc transferase